MTQENTAVESPTKCGCGRSLNMPYCDGSHALSEAQYAERQRQTAKKNQEPVPEK